MKAGPRPRQAKTRGKLVVHRTDSEQESLLNYYYNYRGRPTYHLDYHYYYYCGRPAYYYYYYYYYRILRETRLL